MMPALYIIGAGGHGRVVADIAEALGYTHVFFLDARADQLERNLHWPLAGDLKTAIPKDASVFVAIGSNEARLNLLRSEPWRSHDMPNLIHPTAFISARAKLASGIAAMPQSAVNAGASIGAGVIINTGATVDHDCQIGDGAHISPGAHLAGSVNVGEKSWVGIGAVVREGIKIGRNVMIGAGAVVVSEVPDGVQVVGNPAHRRS